MFTKRSWESFYSGLIIAVSYTHLIINIVLVVTGVFKIYELVYQMTGGGPTHQSELLTSYTVSYTHLDVYKRQVQSPKTLQKHLLL